MSRNSKIIIFSLVLIFSIYQKQSSSDENISEEKRDEVVSTPNSLNDLVDSVNKSNNNINNNVEIDLPISSDEEETAFNRPQNGFSPYDSYFGRGIYNNSVTNYVEIDNQTTNDAVVLLVNASNDRKIRNEYVRKGTKFKMTGVPDGVYYIRMMSGNNWNPNIKVGPLTGGFSKNRSISGNSDSNDWMKIGTTYADSNGRYYEGFSQTLHGVVGGDVESESLTANEFAN